MNLLVALFWFFCQTIERNVAGHVGGNKRLSQQKEIKANEYR